MQVGKGARTTVVCTQGRPTLRDNIQAVYGAKVLSGLEELAAEGDGFALSGFVSSAVKNPNKTNGDRQFFYLNGRPVDLPKAVRVVNDVYRCATRAHHRECMSEQSRAAASDSIALCACRSLSSPATAGCKAMFAIDIATERGRFDVNVTPDKRTVMLQQEKELLALLQGALEELWDPSKRQYSQTLDASGGGGAESQRCAGLCT